MSALTAARMPAADVVRVGALGLLTRPMRAFLSSLGIAIGIAAMVSVLGISSSSRAELDHTLDSLGTNLLTASPGSTMTGVGAVLPRSAEDMVDRIGPVNGVSATGTVAGAKVYRNDRIPAVETNGIVVQAARTDLLELTGTRVATGTWLNEATSRYPAVVLGADAAHRLGIGEIGPDTQVLLGGQWFTVVGILEHSDLASEIDSAALVGWPVAQERLGFDGRATSVYARADPERLSDVRAVLARTANPEAPNEVEVSRPSDALAAQQAADQAFTSLLLGVGAVALLVGGVGVANTMVISVMERRSEIGLRRSLGATQGQIRTQFMTESVLLSFLGGLGGALIGSAITAVYAITQGWTTVIPTWAIGAALGLTVVIGGGAGLLPALRASRLPPTEALAAR